MGCRRKFKPSPVRVSNSWCMVVSRLLGESPESSVADESVIEPPNPVMVWNLRVGSTVTVS